MQEDLSEQNDKQLKEENQEIISCPYCAEKINAKARICRFCRTDLETGESLASVHTEVQQKSFTVGDGVRFGCGSIIIMIVGLILIYIIMAAVIFG